MTRIDLDLAVAVERVLAERAIEAHPCTFASVGMHEPNSINEFHSINGPTVLVEWTWDEAILARGIRSWVCAQYIEATYAMGIRPDFIVIDA